MAMNALTKSIYWIALACFLAQPGFGQWEIVHSFEGCTLTSVSFKNDSLGFVAAMCANEGRIYMTEDFGDSWDLVYEEEGTYLYDVDFPTEDIGFTSAYFNVLKTNDGGYTWAYPDPDASGYQFKSISFQDENIGFGCFISGDLAFAQTSDGGYSWQPITQLTGRAIEKTGDCHFAMLSHEIVTTANCWQDHTGNLVNTNELTNLDFAVSDQGSTLTCGIGFDDETWANYGFIGASEDFGATMEFWLFPQFFKVNVIEFASDQTAYAVGNAHTGEEYFSILKSIDGGSTWFYQDYEYSCPDCNSPDLRTLCCPSESVCYTSSSQGNLWRTVDGGGDMISLDVKERHDNYTGLIIYPNPGKATCELTSLEKISHLRIYRSNGQKVNEKVINSNRASIDVRSLCSGTFIFELHFDSGKIVREIFMKD